MLNEKVNSVIKVCKILHLLKLQLSQLENDNQTDQNQLSENQIDINFLNKNKITFNDSTVTQLISEIHNIKEKFDDNKLIYCLVAMCDRYILDILPEKSDFDRLSLEYTFFKTRNSGKKLFEDIKKALEDLDKQLLEAYLVALLFAFKHQRLAKDLKNIKIDLFKAIYNRNPNESFDEDLFNCQKKNSPVKFQKLIENSYYLIPIILFSSLTILSFLIYQNSTKRLLNEIKIIYKENLNEVKNV